MNTLERIKNGDLHTTTFYDHPYVVDASATNRQQLQSKHLTNFSIYREIVNYIASKDVTGDSIGEKLNPHYHNLRLTNKGEETLRFQSLTLKDIDNSFGKDSRKEWLWKPLILESCKFIVLAVLALIGGAYSSDIKDMFSSPQENSQEETQTIKQQHPQQTPINN